ncbi:MAG TPA: valine--tRNA ligase [Myxococcota bacterium]|nr:valine--tRNA ligase [Myxococcota bacterium]HOH77238.1 valine--tRNA ligase [Myxococcota bacterium]
MEPLAKGYEHREIEGRWYDVWNRAGYFRAADVSDKPPYCIVIPPPNVTGQLHMGHALTLTIQDILIRWKRMSGFNTLWLPGTDHAGIATQMVVERELKATEGLSRFDLGREKFIERVWQVKHRHHDRIVEQMAALGVSVDWERERFTLDDGLSRAVRVVFTRLYEEGLIYRAQRMVNWSPGIQTVLSDLEVEEKELKSHMWHIAYPVTGTSESLVVATTRPETMFGDTAVAVHPKDPRHAHLIGKTVDLPLTGKKIPIIGDDQAVDMEFGTGAVKITPAHDFNDFETGKRHNLPVLSILDKLGNLNDNVPEKYRGMERFAARKLVEADLAEAGLLVKVEDYAHRVGHCQRSGVIVEPMVSMQWFVRAEPLARPAIDAVRDGRTQFVPGSWEKTYMNWMENIRDWCISRQLWWGHQIPVWYCQEPGCDGMYVGETDPGPDTVCPKCGSRRLVQDEDVLDTWFSSGLWPFSTLGWPDRTAALKTFYPTTVMETGFDIIFFWVARMMMMGIHFMDDVPFKTIYLHAMVRDEHGLKMSKTKGNVIDPLEVVEEVGSDALRFTLANMTAQGRDIKLSMDRLKGYREFVNKLWNAARFIFMNLDDFTGTVPSDPAVVAANPKLGRADRWILNGLAQASADCNKALDEFRFNEAASVLYQFTWHQFCDWYLELAKGSLMPDSDDVQTDPERRRAVQTVLIHVLDHVLRSMHPFMPYVTEEIWQKLRPFLSHDEDSVMVANYPTGEGMPQFPEDAAAVESVLEVISAVRGVRAQAMVPPREELPVVIKPHSAEIDGFIRSMQEEVARLGRVASLDIRMDATRPAGSAVVVGTTADCFVVIGQDRIAAEIARLEKEIARNGKDLEKFDAKLSNQAFIANASPEVVDEVREKADAARELMNRMNEARKALRD